MRPEVVPLPAGRPIRPMRPIRLELAPGGAQVLPVLPPPRRPAHLPARFGPVGAAGQVLTAGAGVPTDTPKPNRYSRWAQLERHPLDGLKQAGHSATFGSSAGHAFQQHFSGPFSSAASRVLVINPMQIVNLSEHTKSKLVKSIEALKRFSEKWFSHVLLLLFLAVYACLGAYIFISFEAPSEHSEKQMIIDTRNKILNDSYTESQQLSQEDFTNLFKIKFQDYEKLLNKACQAGITSSSLENQWTFWGALFYSMTVFTTIGYGHLTPITFAGRVATMIYAIFGIPILLMVLADLGKLLTRMIKYAFKKFRFIFNKLLGKKASIRTRELISNNTSQYIGVARGAMERGFAYMQPYNERVAYRAASIRRRLHLSRPLDSQYNDEHHKTGNMKPYEDLIAKAELVTPPHQSEPVSPVDLDISAGGKPTSNVLKAVNQFEQQIKNSQGQNYSLNNSTQSLGKSRSPNQSKRKTNSSQSSTKRKTSNPKSSLSCSSSNSNLTAEKSNKQAAYFDNQLDNSIETHEIDDVDIEEHEEDDHHEHPEDEEDDFDIPVSFALFLLIAYMMLGAVAFSIWEGWNFFDALYFVFISMSTIGFGDLVPQHPKRMIGTFAYLLFGLALTSMCINVVQEKIHATFLRAKMQIGEKMGLDLEQIMADDLYDTDDINEDSHSTSNNNNNSNHDIIEPNNSDNLDIKSLPVNEQPTQTLDMKPTEQIALPASSSKNFRNSFKWGRRSAERQSRQGRRLARSPSGGRQPASRTSSPPSAQPAAPLASADRPAESATNEVDKEDSVTVATECPLDEPQQVSEPTPSPANSTSLPLVAVPSVVTKPESPIVETKVAVEPLKVEPQRATISPPVKITESCSYPIALASTVTPSRLTVNPAVRPGGSLYRPAWGRANRSASSSPRRRASVSHELSQLDDLIQALSRSPPPERFGRLLGVPATVSRRGASASPRSQHFSAV